MVENIEQIVNNKTTITSNRAVVISWFLILII